MNLVNTLLLPAGFTLAFEPDGRELLVVAVKGTYDIPGASGLAPRLAAEQMPLVEADRFTGDPGYSATLYETDYAPRKPACDVLANCTAYAPGGKAVDRLRVGLRVGSLAKSFDVVGNRFWRAGLAHCTASRPEPFVVMPISYDRAFGGVDTSLQDPSRCSWYALNHAGVGYWRTPRGAQDRPLPNTEQPFDSITRPNGSYQPMAFGAVGRAWEPRCRLAGTYDQAWLDSRAPFWPDDLDWRYFQAAAADQQTKYLMGGETVVLVNLTADGNRQFVLPRVDLPLLLVHHRGPDIVARPVVDTLLLEPDLGRFSMTWRLSHPLRRSLFELKEVVIGQRRSKPQPGLEKPHYANLDQYIRSLPPAARRGNPRS